MSRRAGGAILLVLVLLTVAVLSALRTGVIVGSATAVPVPEAPVVGDCLLQPAQVASASAGLEPAAATYGHCTGGRYGDVAGLIPDGLSDLDESRTRCTAVALEYLGLSKLMDTTFQTATGWSPVLTFLDFISTPDARQVAAGQKWVGCIVGSTAAASGSAALYQGTLRDAPLTGALTDSFVACAQDPWLSDDQRPCSAAHRYQILATEQLTASAALDADVLQSSCNDLVRSMTRMPDITAAGKLTVQVSVTRYDQAGGGLINQSAQTPLITALTAIRPGEIAILNCTVRSTVTGQQLVGSIIGLGARKVKLAG